MRNTCTKNQFFGMQKRVLDKFIIVVRLKKDYGKLKQAYLLKNFFIYVISTYRR